MNLRVGRLENKLVDQSRGFQNIMIGGLGNGLLLTHLGCGRGRVKAPGAAGELPGAVVERIFMNRMIVWSRRTAQVRVVIVRGVRGGGT